MYTQFCKFKYISKIILHPYTPLQILQLESDLTQLEVDRDKHSRSAMASQERLSALERDRKDLADEYVGLKANYSSLKGAHDREVGVLSTSANLIISCQISVLTKRVNFFFIDPKWHLRNKALFLQAVMISYYLLYTKPIFFGQNIDFCVNS